MLESKLEVRRKITDEFLDLFRDFESAVILELLWSLLVPTL